MNPLSKHQAVMIALTAFGGGLYFPTSILGSKTNPERSCKNCGQPHTHSNCCCSAKCFKEWKSK